jgi:hypothetical protein
MKNSTAVPSGAAENRSLTDFIRIDFARCVERCQAFDSFHSLDAMTGVAPTELYALGCDPKQCQDLPGTYRHRHCFSETMK